MKVKMLVGLSGPATNLSPGDEYDFPNDEALRFIEAGFAVPVVEIQRERAVKKPITEKRKAK